MIITLKTGTPIRELYNNGYEINEKIIYDLAAFIKKYHNIKISKLKTVNVESWREYFKLKRKNLMEEEFDYPYFSNKLKKQLKERFEKLNFDRYKNFKLIHADLTEDHILIENDNFKGVIDFADSKVAPVEYEWVVLYLSGLNRELSYFRKFLSFYGLELNENTLESIIDFIFLHQFVDGILNSLFKEKYIHDLEEFKSEIFEMKR